MAAIEYEIFSSGGEFNHLIVRMDNNHIVLVHLPFMDVEYSHKPYDSIQQYMDENAFGYEYEKPNYDARNTNLVTLFSNLINLAK